MAIKETAARIIPARLDSGTFLRTQVHGGFITNVDRQPKETYSHNFQRNSFIPFPAVNVRVDRHAPQYGDTRRYFNKTINPKPNQRDTAGKRSRDYCHQAFQGVPGNGEIFQALSAPRYQLTIDCKLCHPQSIRLLRARSIKTAASSRRGRTKLKNPKSGKIKIRLLPANVRDWQRLGLPQRQSEQCMEKAESPSLQSVRRRWWWRE